MTPDAYSDVFAALAQYQARYVVVSGVAVALHGVDRPVYDLDIVIDATPPAGDQAMMVLMSAGFIASVPLPLSMVTVLRMFDADKREIDVFARYHIPFEELWADSMLVPVGETVARVVSRERLIEAKRLVGRPHDLTDVEGLLALG